MIDSWELERVLGAAAMMWELLRLKISTLWYKVQGDVFTLKVPSKICGRHFKFLLFYFSEKTSLDISCESSVKQTIHIKCKD